MRAPAHRSPLTAGGCEATGEEKQRPWEEDRTVDVVGGLGRPRGQNVLEGARRLVARRLRRPRGRQT